MKKFYLKSFLARKSFFLRFLRSHLLVLLIPLAAILVMYYSAHVTIQEEILTANANSLNQFVTIIDREFNNMIEKASQILTSGAIRKQVLFTHNYTDPSSAYEIYETKNYLDDLPQEDFSDIFVYFNQADRIVSAENSSLSSQEYYETYYRKAYDNLLDTEDNYDTFRSLLTPDSLLPHLVSLGKEYDTPSLGVILSMNYYNTKKKGDTTAVLVLQPELLKRLISSAMYRNNGSILIYDNNNTLLVSTKQEELDFDLSNYIGNSDNIYYDTFSGENYIIQLFPSQVLNCTYVSLISSDTFWEKLYGMRSISMASILLGMLVSILVSWLLARRSYLPIDSIVHTIYNKSDFHYDLKQESELDFIKEVLINTFTENDMLSSRIKNSRNNLFEDFLLHAMQGTLSNKKYQEKEYELHRSNFISDAFRILLVHIDTANEAITGPLDSNEGQSMLSLITGNILIELCTNTNRGFVINLMPKVYAVLLNYSEEMSPEDQPQTAMEISHSFQRFVKQYFGIISTISISNPVKGIGHINNAYQQALSAMEYRYLMGKGSIIPYQDTVVKKFTYSNSFNSKNTLILIHYVKENTNEEIDDIIGEIINNSSIDSNSSLSVIECFKYDLINSINKIIFEIGAMDLEKQNNFLHTLIHAETFSDFKEALQHTLVQLKKYYEDSKEQFTICDRAEVLIHECYMDINLNNSNIADRLNISPSYLSKLFKNQKNISLLDYLYQVRLSIAKKLLRETNLTVEEIAAKTGFISNSALTKTFKKYEGITPGSYRRLIT